jgi:hypothetical protein
MKRAFLLSIVLNKYIEMNFQYVLGGRVDSKYECGPFIQKFDKNA